MSESIASEDSLWPLSISYPLLGDQGAEAVIKMRPGITTLVGPNGSGKTRSLRAIKEALTVQIGRIGAQNRKVHFLSAGRSSPFEVFRAKVDYPHHMQTEDAAIGQATHLSQWWDYESVTGDLIVLDDRPDLKLKIEARLQQLFDRSISLKWTQSGMIVRITSVAGGDSYAANYEASEPLAKLVAQDGKVAFLARCDRFSLL